MSSVRLKIFKKGELVHQAKFSQDLIVLGSSETQAHILIPGAAPTHAIIEKRGSEYILKDLGSGGGTYKNKDKILEAQIQSGDMISIGDLSIEFSLQQISPSPQAPPGLDLTPEVVSSSDSPHPKPHSVPRPFSSLEESVEQEAEGVVKEVVEESKAQRPQTPGPVKPVSPGIDSVKTHGGPTPSSGSQSEGRPKVAGKSRRHSGVVQTPWGPKTFAPQSIHRDVEDFIKPKKGQILEVLVTWKERVISVYHFNKQKVLTVGTHPSSDILVPVISSNVNSLPMIELGSVVNVLLHPGMRGSLVGNKKSSPIQQVSSSGTRLALHQGEMIRVDLGQGIEIVMRYSSETPPPSLIPFIDFASSGFLAVLFSIFLAFTLSFYVLLNRVDKVDRLDEDKYRTALIITNPPKPPKPVVQPPVAKQPPPKVKKKPSPPKKSPKKKLVKKRPVKKKVVKKKPKKVVRSAVKSLNKQVKRARVVKKKIKSPPKAAGKKSTSLAKSRSNKPRKALRKAVKNTNKKATQLSAQRDVKKSGIFSAFGGGGQNNRVDKSYSGGGDLAGLADKASGAAGFSRNSRGSGSDSPLKSTGSTQGRSNVGVSGLSSRGRSGGDSLVAVSGSLGGRKSVDIVTGGSGEEFKGEVDRQGIYQVFLDNKRSIRSCYERQLNRGGNLSGKIMLSFDIGSRGRVVGQPKVIWKDSTLKNKKVATCILRRLKQWRFPEPPGLDVEVNYPLIFTATK